MLLQGSYKGTRKRRYARPRTLEEIFGIDPASLRKLGFAESEIQEMARSDYFQGGNFLKAKDFKNGQIVLIDEFNEAKTRIGTRPILRFRGFDAPFGLNATNYDTLVQKFGEDEKKWAGKKVHISIIQAPNPSNGGKMGPAVRLE